MIHIYDGGTGQGKTYMNAIDILDLLHRNEKWFKKGKIPRRRLLASNMLISKWVHDLYPSSIIYWSEIEDLIQLRECDIIMDDMGAYLDARRWKEMTVECQRWFRLHEHYGCSIYGNAQDFLTIDIAIRRITTTVDHVQKLMGSQRPCVTKPVVKHIWGIIKIQGVHEEEFEKDKMRREYYGFPKFKFIKKDICEVFDTLHDLKVSNKRYLNHYLWYCKNELCDYHNEPKVTHA